MLALSIAVAAMLAQVPPWPVWQGAAQLSKEDRCQLVLAGLDYCAATPKTCGNFYRLLETDIVDVEMSNGPVSSVPYPGNPDGGSDFSGSREHWEQSPWDPDPSGYPDHLFAAGEECSGRGWRVLSPPVLLDPKTLCIIYRVVLVPEPGSASRFWLFGEVGPRPNRPDECPGFPRPESPGEKQERLRRGLGPAICACSAANFFTHPPVVSIERVGKAWRSQPRSAEEWGKQSKRWWPTWNKPDGGP